MAKRSLLSERPSYYWQLVNRTLFNIPKPIILIVLYDPSVLQSFSPSVIW